MNNLSDREFVPVDNLALAPAEAAPLALFSVLDQSASQQLLRMFRDPRVLEPQERGDLIAQLRKAVELAPQVSEVRVLLGMALCVDLQAQDALEELREATRLSPNSFIARLKFGELLMRLRICGQAEEETRQAALLAKNAAQSELARRQAATIRAMLRDGVERGGYGGVFSRFFRKNRKSGRINNTPVLAGR